MAASIRLLTGLTVMATALGGLELVWPHWAEDLDRGRITGDQATWVVVPRQPEHEVVATRMEARREVVKRLAAGEITLFVAAAQFRQLNNSPENFPDRGWRSIEGRCEGEKMCRQVLIWAEIELRDWMTPSQVDGLLHQWEADLACHIACQGRVVLPEA